MRKIIMFILSFSIILILTSSVYSYYRDDSWECTSRGEASQGDAYGRRLGDICEHTCCMFCVSTHPMSDCFGSNAQPMCSCSSSQIADTEPPTININSPEDDSIHGERRVLFDIDFNEEQVEMAYYSIDGARPTRLCVDCESIVKSISLRDGEHTVEITAKDYHDNYANKSVNVFVDTKSPIIKKTRPLKGKYTNGLFTVEYYEINLNYIMLNYWASPANHVLLEGCTSGKKESCSINVDLSAYDGQDIYYNFTVADHIRSADSKIQLVHVDTTPPEMTVNSPVDEGSYPRKVPMNITISEKVEKLEYADNGDEPKNLCSKCQSYYGSKYFTLGEHTISITATDFAGNQDEASLSFTVT